jgi:hypothetical protein
VLEAFKEFLNNMYWEGYADEFEDDNPTAFYSQLKEFKLNHQLPL